MKACEQDMELIASKQMLRNKFVEKTDHKELIKNRKLIKD